MGRALLVWPLLLSLIVVFGSSGFVLLAADAIYDLRAATASLLPLWRILAILACLVSPFVLLDMTGDMAGVSWKSALPLVPEVLADTHAGRVWDWFLTVALLLLVSACVPLGQSLRAIMLFVLTGLLLFLHSLLSHAVDKGALAIAFYFVHEVAVALWLGSLMVLWIIARRGDAPKIKTEHAAQRVSEIAFWAVVALVISGTYIAYNGLGLNLHQLLFSNYGRTLMVKVAVFLVVLAIGAYNRYWLVPAVADPAKRETLVRNIGVESVILLFAVLGLAALLANTPPAHDTGGHAGHSMLAMISFDPIRRLLKGTP